MRPNTRQFIVFLGTDGSGKSSVINGICDGLDEKGYETHKFHLRPSFGEDSGKTPAPVTDPHGKPPYGEWVSTIKIIYLFLFYWCGHLIKVRPLLRRNAVVLFDRYYHDMLVDTKRYRYGGSSKLARLVGELIPKPGLWILLDAPPEVLQSRKQEVPFEETVRQRNEYLKFIKEMKNGIVVDSSRCIADVIADANIAILNFRAERVEKSLAQ